MLLPTKIGAYENWKRTISRKALVNSIRRFAVGEASEQFLFGSEQRNLNGLVQKNKGQSINNKKSMPDLCSKRLK